jgi:hypothetical protein
LDWPENPAGADPLISGIVATRLDRSCLKEGKPDPEKIDPVVLTMPDNHYRTPGNAVGSTGSCGKELIGKRVYHYLPEAGLT